LEAESPPAPAPATPVARPLYSPGGIAAFTFFFTPAVGGLVAATNLRRVGRSADAWKAIGVGVGTTVVLIILGALLPDRFDAVARGGAIGATIGVANWYRYQQKPIFEAHRAAGGRRARGWPIALAGSVGLAIFIAAAIAAAVYGSPDTARFQEGSAALERKDNPAAEAAFREAVALDPSDDSARYNLALAIARQGRRDDALHELSQIGPSSEMAERARDFEKRLAASTPDE
jgi:hypothetical protein